MRIAFVDFVCDPNRPGVTGLSDLVWDMASRLARAGDDVHVVAPYSVTASLDPAVHVDRFPLPRLGYRNIAGHILIVRAAIRRLRSLDAFDLVHVPDYLSAAMLASSAGLPPVVLTEPGNIYERVARGNPYDAATTIVYKVAARVAAARCPRLVATSDEMARWWRATGFAADRVARLPLGIDTRLFRRVHDAKRQLSWSSEVPSIVYAARLSRENGVDLALRALPRLIERTRPMRLHVLGDGPERRALFEQSRLLGIDAMVTWHGWVDLRRLPLYYSAADVFLFAGRSGGTPRVLLQAMACGAPVVASAIGGIVDHVRDGVNGLLFPSGDSEALASRVERVMLRPELARRLGAEAGRYARQEVDWDRLVDRLRRDVYGPLVEGSRRPRCADGQRAGDPLYG